MEAHHHSHNGRRRQRRPSFDGLEVRVLMDREGPDLPGGHFPAADVQQFVPLLYPAGMPQPTPAEVRRESFVAKGYGEYTVGSGRFNTQSIVIHGFGKPASSNFSSTSHFQFVIAEPSNPSLAVTGVAQFLVEDYPSTGGNLILDLVGPTGTEVNGLPTRLNWVHDPASGTIFTGTGSALPDYSKFPANYFNASGDLTNPFDLSGPTSVDNWNTGLGDATFRYFPSKHPIKGTLGSGTVVIVFRGLINSSGAQSANDQNYN